MSTFSLKISYNNGHPLESATSVDLLANGTVIATANPDATGLVVFNIASGNSGSLGESLSVRLTPISG